MKNGLIYGIIAGVTYLVWVVIGGSTIPYLVYGSIPSILISSLFGIIFMILACRKEKAALNSSLRFGEAFLVCLMTYLAFNIIYAIGFKIYLEVSPSAMTSFIEITKTSTADLMAKMGAPEDEIFKSIEGLEESLPKLLTWKTTLLNIFGSTIFPGALIALIVAAIFSKFSKNPPTV